MPPVVSYVSPALGGISYATTGKSVGDHALSAATEQDCALWRAVSEQEIEAVCQDRIAAGDDAPENAPDAPAAPSDTTVPAMIGSIEPSLVRIDPAKVPVIPPAVAVVANTPPLEVPAPAATTNSKAIYLVLGSFTSVGGAKQLAAWVPGIAAGITTAIASALVGEDRYYRVVAGPYELDETSEAQSRLAAAGIGNVWAARLCTNDLLAPPCE